VRLLENKGVIVRPIADVCLEVDAFPLALKQLLGAEGDTATPAGPA
jgi:hypothetical protein